MKPKIAATIFSATGFCLITLASGPAQGQVVREGATNPTIGPKGTIEPPLEGVIRGSAPISWSGTSVARPAGPTYFYGASTSNPGPKAVVESPLERTIRRSSPLSWSETPIVAPIKSSAVDVDLPQPDSVKPGLVAWQPDFQAACRASAKSSKPVLLFQMMGRLDQEFC